METPSLGGSRYTLTFIDDASRKASVYFLKLKTDVLEAFEDMSYVWESDRIKRIRTANGKEYVNRVMWRYLSQAGIHHETTVPYNPEQNGLAERMNRTLVERAKSMLFDAKLDKRFWADTVANASCVINCSPTKGILVTPEEIFTGKRPDLSHPCVFGSEVMVDAPKEKRQKWDAKAERGIFIGYSENSKDSKRGCTTSKHGMKQLILTSVEQTTWIELNPSMEETSFEINVSSTRQTEIVAATWLWLILVTYELQ